MEWKDIVQNLKKGQTQTTRFIGTLTSPEELGPSLVGMANTKGGIIFIGIDVKNYHLWGTKIDKEWVDQIINKNIRPKINITLKFIEKNDKIIIAIELLEGEEKPYYFNNICYIMDEHNPKIALLECQQQITPLVTSRPSIEKESEEDLSALTSELIELSNSTSPPQKNTPLVKETLHTTNTEESSAQKPTLPKAAYDLNHRQKNALEVIFEEQSIRNKKYRELFNVSHKTAHIELVDMVGKGYINPSGQGRSTCYILKSAIAQ